MTTECWSLRARLPRGVVPGVPLRDMVNNRKIFANSYWGNFRFHLVGWSRKVISNNINNRNKLVEEYKIKSYKGGIPLKKTKYFEIPNIVEFSRNSCKTLDHCEYYYTSDKKHILIFSDKLNFHDDDDYEILLNNGYFEYPSIYGTIRTFMKIV